MQFDPHQLAALSEVLRLGSFEAAAGQLSVTPSAVSQRIKALEDRTGAALIRRGTPCIGTPLGIRLAKHAEDIGLLEAQLSRELSLDGGPAPARLRVAVNADSLATWFVAAMEQVPDLLFDLVLDDQDHSADWLRRGAVSATVCARDKPVAGCDMHDLGVLRYVAVASPAFHERWFAQGVTRETLAQAPMLTFNAKDALQQIWLDTYIGTKLSPPSHFLPSSHAFVDAARANIGWGMMPFAQIRGHLKHARLIPLLPKADIGVALSWQVNRIMAPALKPVTRAVIDAATKVLHKA
ncbi:LysR family transcriptional regulator ArgP [Rhodobacteraceae bacterium M382]|nr:LysR family transcriptional regulator ArgP [Rhodobacteraceae bacterium M382]